MGYLKKKHIGYWILRHRYFANEKIRDGSLCSRQKAADLANRMACGAFPRFWGVPEKS